MDTYCNVWKVALKLGSDNYECPSNSDLKIMSYTLRLIYDNNNDFASKVKNGDLIENTACDDLGYSTTGVYIISFKETKKSLKILNLATAIDSYGYIPKKFSNIVLEKSLNYWHNLKQIDNNVFIITNGSIVKGNLDFSWNNSLVPILPSTIQKNIKKKNVRSIKLNNKNSDIATFILNIIKIKNNDIGIISRETNIFHIDKLFKKADGKFYDENETNYIDMDDPKYDVSIENELEYYYYTKTNSTFKFENEIENDGWDFEDFEELVSNYIDINKCLLKITNNITEVNEIIE